MSQAIQIIDKAKDQFLKIQTSQDNMLVWNSEANFAMQAIHKNDFSMKAFKNNPDSLRDAIINVASIGLSLNPATSYAYLVPRDGAICLDIGYQGLIKIATDTGSIMWAKADVVYSSDKFEYNGPAKIPTHTANPFAKDRGEVIGVYCIAKTCEGDYLIETMTEDEIQDIKEKSPSAKSGYSPWNTFPNEMRKKAVIKRASKTWPKTEKHERLAKVIEHVNQEEGIDFNEPSQDDINLIDDYLHQKNGAAIDNLLSGDPAITTKWASIISTFAGKGQKGKHKEMVQEWRNEATNYVHSLAVNIQESQDPTEIAEMYKEMNEHEVILFWRILSPETRINIENLLNQHGIEIN